MTLSDDDLKSLLTLTVTGVAIKVAMRRSVKMGDEWHTFEADETWTFGGQDLSPALAKRVQHVHGPALIKNVVMALHAGGVLPLEAAKEVVARATKIYTLAVTGGVSDTAGNQSGVPDAGGAGDPVGAPAGAGAGVPDPQAD